MAKTETLAPEPAPEPDPVVAVWLGDESRFISNVPNRDIVASDGVPDDLLELAFKAGLHRPPEETE